MPKVDGGALRVFEIFFVLILTLSVGSATAEVGQPVLLAPLTDGGEVALPALDPSVPSPAEYLGYPLGERFTPHHELLGYLETLASHSPRVELWTYGKSYEDRPLILVAISSPEKISELDEIRDRRSLLLRPETLTAKRRNRLTAELPAVVWLGYGIHGDESSSSEAALAAAYTFAAGKGRIRDQLDELVLLIDPLSNPDGRGRYIHDFVIRRGEEPNPDPAAAEHRESWPGGRGNHYYLDLNRDWAWATQRETRDRLAAIRRWDPQVVVDFHEMGSGSTYFFPPFAQPIHPEVEGRVSPWLDRFGRSNARAFDRHGWLYFVEEQYDLFYPAYGDSYPTLRGAIGMTYEMAGGGRAGTVIRLPDGDTLTLADRIARHLTTSLATVETAGEHAGELVGATLRWRLGANRAEEGAYLWAPDQPEGRSLAELLSLHGIEVVQTLAEVRLQVESTREEDRQRRIYPPGSYVVPIAQPLGPLARSLLQREAPLPPSFLERQRQRIEENLSPDFYDVTAWSLPLAYNVPVHFHRGDLPETQPLARRADRSIEGDEGIGLLAPPRGLTTYRFAAALQREGIRYRVALEPLASANREYPAGTLFIPRSPREDDLQTIRAAAGRTGQELAPVSTSLTTDGISLGSGSMLRIRPVRIGLLRGPGLSPTGFGALWHLLDREIDTDLTVVDRRALSGTDLGRFDVLVLPDGWGYEDLGQGALERMNHWIREGGTLIALKRAGEWIGQIEEISFDRLPSDERGSPPPRDSRASGLVVPGAVVATETSRHPLAVGLPRPPPLLFRGATFMEASGDPRRDVAIVRERDPVLAGFAW
ncbi:MAG: M14 family zinc carboxypeptidase, partial [Thermoanaerobaculia bacterium]|nr:M14 family zinc carboxypeptidase [Thermoanaerobaculia bacterium]